MTRQTRAQWLKRVRRWAKSGLDAEAFAAQEGIEARTLVWWRWRLGMGPRAGVLPAVGEHVESTTPTFLEVALRPAAAAARVVSLPDTTSEALEVHVGGHRVVVRPGFDEASLRRLLSVLEGR